MTITQFAELQTKIKFLTTIYKSNPIYDANKVNLGRSARVNLLVAKIFSLTIGSTVAVLCVLPIGVYFVTGRSVPITPIRIPFVQNDTATGLNINNLFNLLLISMGSMATLGQEIFAMTLAIHIWPMVRILKRAVTAQNEAINGPNREAIRNSTWLRLRFRNIILMHSELFS